MEGLFAFANLGNDDVRTCRFPFGATQCKRMLAKLRRRDPPFDDQGVPSQPLPTIAPEDRVVAYHFLVRALFFMLNDETAMINEAVPYLMAFSTLAQTRFAVVEVWQNAAEGGLEIMTTPLEETDFDKVNQMFQGMAAPRSGLTH